MSLTNHRAISGITSEQKVFCYTPIADKFRGSHITDLDGHDYVDITMGFGVHLFGHHPEFIAESIQKVNASSWGLGPLTSAMFNLAHSIKKLTGVDRMSFFSTGTEAIMVAARLARAYTNKSKIVIFKGAYHGHNEATLVFKTDPMSGQPLALVPGITESSQADTILLDFDSADSLKFVSDHANEIAAVLTEPVQSRNPGCHPVHFLKQLRDVTQEKNIVLIFDEIITGFRIHPGGAQVYFDIRADLVTYGKVLGGGMPFGVVAGKGQIIDLIDGGCWNYKDNSMPAARKTFVAGTFCNHPLTLAAANAIVEELVKTGDRFTASLNQVTSALVNEMNEWMKAQNIPVVFSCFGSLFRIEIPTTARLFYHHLLLEGLYIWEGKTCFLSTAHTEHDIEFVKKKIRKVCLLMKSCGYFPGRPKTAVREYSALIEACRENYPLNISLNIGVSLRVEGAMDEQFLEIAFRYVCMKEAALLPNDVGVCIHRKAISSGIERDKSLREFVDRDLVEEGVGLLMLFLDMKLVHFAFIGHKSKLDGWSLTVLLTRIIDVYDALSLGKPLPDFGQSSILEVHERTTQGVHASLMEKKSYHAKIDFLTIKKSARYFEVSAIHLFEAAFAIAYSKTINVEAQHIVIGSPVAGQFKRVNRTSIGPYTYISARKYLLKDSADIKQIMSTASEVPSHDVSFVVNIDRIMGTKDNRMYHLTPAPLDPSYIRYDIVVNILAGRENGLWIDVKWRTERYTSDTINTFIECFNALIQDLYVTSASEQ